MWTDKYKPAEFNQFVGNTEIIGRIASLADHGVYQHLIVSGSTGTGKTTAVNLLIRKVLGDKISQALLKISSVDNHDIQTIREKIHQFVPKKVVHDNGTKTKIVLFENADDTLTEGTQQVMRRLMEQHLHHAIFIFVCKHANKIIESIHSRCQTLRFFPVSETDQIQHYRTLCEKEDILFEEDALQWIAKISEGDMRIGMNYLQSFSFSKNINSISVKDESIFPYTTDIETCLQRLLAKDMIGAMAIPKRMSMQGFSALDIIMFIGNVTKYYDVENGQKIVIMKYIAVAYKKIIEGIDSILQIYSMFANIVSEID